MKRKFVSLFIIAFLFFLAFEFFLMVWLDMKAFDSNFDYVTKVTIMDGDEILAVVEEENEVAKIINVLDGRITFYNYVTKCPGSGLTVLLEGDNNKKASLYMEADDCGFDVDYDTVKHSNYLLYILRKIDNRSIFDFVFDRDKVLPKLSGVGGNRGFRDYLIDSNILTDLDYNY